jgi:hypothetical protein
MRTFVAIVAQKGWHVHHMDVKPAFLNGNIQEAIATPWFYQSRF